MLFAERFEGIMKKRGVTFLWRLWFHTAWVSVGIFLFCFWYLALTEPGSLSVTANKALADGAMILIGLSFALSGLCYFWDLVDTKIVYRKYLGLSGFAFALGHAVMSLVFYLFLKPRGYETSPAFIIDYQWDFGVFFVSNFYAFACAVVALIIFALMAAISNQYAVVELGGLRWRRLLQVGYFAYVFAMLHFLIKNMPEWGRMLRDPGVNLPPLNFWIFLLACGVIGLRLALWRALWVKARIISSSAA